jgi:hypothetical protein
MSDISTAFKPETNCYSLDENGYLSSVTIAMKVVEEGIEFRSPIDGTTYLAKGLTPEMVEDDWFKVIKGVDVVDEMLAAVADCGGGLWGPYDGSVTSYDFNNTPEEMSLYVRERGGELVKEYE